MRVAGVERGEEGGLVPALGERGTDRPGPPNRAAQVRAPGMPAPGSAPHVHVRHVLRLGARGQVLDVDAAGLLAGMQQPKPGRAQPAGVFPGPPVRVHRAGGRAGTGLEPAIPVVADRADPVMAPTRARVHDDLRHEASQLGLRAVRRDRAEPVENQLLVACLERPTSHAAQVRSDDRQS